MVLTFLVERIVGSVVYVALLFIYVPIYILGYLTIQRNLIRLKLQKWLGFRVSHSRLGLVSRKSRVTDVSQVSTDEEIDFQANRSLSYVHRMTLWTPVELTKTVLRHQTIDLMTDEQLAFVILSTVYAHSVAWDGEREMYRLKMEGFEDLFLFQGFYWDARHVLVSPDASKLIIQMDDGQELHSDVTDPEGRADYNLAKLHVQICLSYFAPGLSHNHVHFVFPSAVCILSKTKLKHSGVLYKLLSPHFRFTERINYQALRVGKATNNKRSQLDRLFFFWQPFPVTKEQFMEGVARKCKRYYVERGSVCYDSKDMETSESPTSNGDGPTPTDASDEDIPPRHHFIFPPEYVTDKKLQKIPYLAFLREYYLVVRRFVKAMVPFIDSSEWETLSAAVAQHVPRFQDVDIVDAIATFIHQVGVVHYCDHNSYTDYFAYKYGCMAIRTPFESFQSKEHWKDISAETGYDVDLVKKNPLLLIRQRDVMRTRCFLNIFVDYIPNPKCNMQLSKTEYDFQEAGQKQAAKDFMSQLRALDGNLKMREPPLYIPQRKGDLRPVGMQIIPLDRIVRSVCF